MVTRSKITSIGSYIPEKVYTNFDLEDILDTSDEWIKQRTGIEQRYWANPSQSTSDLALEASLDAINKSGISKSEIDMIIFATLSPDHDFPGNACFLQKKLELENIPTLDIRQQCSGFIYGLSIANNFICSNQYKHILLVGAEIHSKGLDKTPRGRNVSVLFGDGAGAAIISATEVNSIKKDAHIIKSHLHADGKYAKELWLPAPGYAFPSDRITPLMLEEGLHYPQMNGKKVFTHAVKKMCETLVNICKDTNININDIDAFFFHQANLRINSKVAEILEIPESKIFNTIQKYGNTTAATIPIGMSDATKENFLKPGMLVACVAFGSGFTWGSTILRY